MGTTQTYIQHPHHPLGTHFSPTLQTFRFHSIYPTRFSTLHLPYRSLYLTHTKLRICFLKHSNIHSWPRSYLSSPTLTHIQQSFKVLLLPVTRLATIRQYTPTLILHT